MSRYLPPLNALRAFEAAGRHQSFSRSADELNVSHAAVSRHVRGLEKRLGVQLFKNVARGVELTEMGRQYLDQITPALEQISQASESIRRREDGKLSISCEPTFALKWLMPRLGHIFEALKDRDAQAAEERMRTHIKTHNAEATEIVGKAYSNLYVPQH